MNAKDILEAVIEYEGACRLRELPCSNCPLWKRCCVVRGIRTMSDRKSMAVEELATMELDEMLREKV